MFVFVLKHGLLAGICIAIYSEIVTSRVAYYFKSRNTIMPIATSDTALTIKLYFSFV